MTFDPTLPTLRDYIRFALNDTSNDADTEYLPDATYDAVIALYGGTDVASAATAPVLRAMADLAESAAIQLDQRIVTFGATGDMNIGWGDRARTLRAKAIAFRTRADLLDPPRRSGVFTITTIGELAVDA